jgi:hypothetical protein
MLCHSAMATRRERRAYDPLRGQAPWNGAKSNGVSAAPLPAVNGGPGTRCAGKRRGTGLNPMASARLATRRERRGWDSLRGRAPWNGARWNGGVIGCRLYPP